MLVFAEPPTVLLYPGAPLNPTAENVVTIRFSLKNGPAGVLVPLFIGAEPAQRFLQLLGKKGEGMTPVPVGGLDALEVLLVELKQHGVTHVNFNAEPDHPNPIPIDEVIDNLRNRP